MLAQLTAARRAEANHAMIFAALALAECLLAPCWRIASASAPEMFRKGRVLTAADIAALQRSRPCGR